MPAYLPNRPPEGCEFCDLPLEEHRRVDAPGSEWDGLLIHRWPVDETTWDVLQELLDDGGP